MAGLLIPDIFEYRDYRAFLRTYYSENRAQGAAVSLRGFSSRAGLSSPNYLKLVMDGKRNLTQEMAPRFAQAVGLQKDALAYFCDLVAFNQARTADDRELAYQRLTRFARYRKTHTLDAAQARYHANWYLPAIRELVARHDFIEDEQWIAQRLQPRITPREARAALATLEELSLLLRDENGRLVQSEELLETPDSAQQPLSHHVANYHRAMIHQAALAIDRVPREEREIAALTLCLSSEQLRDLKSDLQRMRAELLQKYTVSAEAQRVVQVNIQMFPLSSEE